MGESKSIPSFLAKSNVCIDRSRFPATLMEHVAGYIHLSMMKRCGKSYLLQYCRWLLEHEVDSETGEAVKV